MKKLLGLVLISLISMSFISALCEEGQIDINTASKGELEELYLMGPVKAERIINARPFDFVDEIIEIYGIGEKTLEGIKEQGLACINEEIEDIEEEEIQEEYIKENIEIKEEIIEEEIEKDEHEKIETITLNTKSIKRENNNENPDKNNYAVYGFVVFCVLLGFLFIFKKRKNYKTEFEENENGRNKKD